jgi:hypothetical protein
MNNVYDTEPLTSYLSVILEKITYVFTTLKFSGIYFDLTHEDIHVEVHISDYNYLYYINIKKGKKISKCKIIFDLIENKSLLQWYLDGSYKDILNHYSDEHLSDIISMTINYSRIE